MEMHTYLKKHLIVQNCLDSPNYLCLEAIFDNPEELISILSQTEYHICHISWWDYVSLADTSSIGYGGVRDPNNPMFYFAETDICRDFDCSTTSEEYLDYLLHVKSMYPNHTIFPAFDIKRHKGISSICTKL